MQPKQYLELTAFHLLAQNSSSFLRCGVVLSSCCRVIFIARSHHDGKVDSVFVTGCISVNTPFTVRLYGVFGHLHIHLTILCTVHNNIAVSLKRARVCGACVRDLVMMAESEVATSARRCRERRSRARFCDTSGWRLQQSWLTPLTASQGAVPPKQQGES